MSAWIWALTFTVLGSSPEHGTYAKYETRQACEEVLASMKQEAQKQKKRMVGGCVLVLRDKK